MQNEAIVCRRISKGDRGRKVLDQMNMTIHAGRVTGLLGLNGAGKSTCMRLWVGMDRPDSGEVRVLGSAPDWQTRKQLAFLPDRAKWFPDHKPADAIRWASQVYPDFDEAYAQELVERLRLSPERPAKNLSRGEEARMMLAMVLARRSDLILLDEPFAGVDALSREAIIEALIETMAQRPQQTTVLTTHQLEEAEGLLEDVVMIHKGRVCVSGEADQLRRDYGSTENLLRRFADEEEGELQ